MSSILRTLRFLGCFATHLAAVSCLVQAQISVDGVFPPVVSRGALTTVVVDGKLTTWPLDVYCDRSDIRVSCTPEKGKLEVQVPEKSQHGIAWIRLFDSKSASALVPILIDPTNTATELEPNDRPSQAKLLDSNTAVAGRLEKSEDVDCYLVRLEKGEQFIASVVASQILGSPMDAVLQIADQNGNVLAQSDDERGTDPQLVFRAAEDMDYLVRLFAFPATPNSTIGFAGGKNFVYVLRLSTADFSDHGLPLIGRIASKDSMIFGPTHETPGELLQPTEVSPLTILSDGPGWQWLQPLDEHINWNYEFDYDTQPDSAIGPPAVLSGHIHAAREVDRFQIALQADKKYQISCRSREFGFKLDPTVRIIDTETGKQVGEGKDIARSDYDVRFDFKPPSSKTYELQILDAVDAHGFRHAYSVSVVQHYPHAELSLPSDRLVIVQGGSTETTLSISRQTGFDATLKIEASGLPPGVTLQNIESAPTGESSKSVKLRLMAEDNASPFQGWIEFTGRTSAAEPRLFRARHALPSFKLERIWLTVAPK